MTPLGRLFWILALAAFAGVPALCLQAQNISTVSPFLPRNGAGVGAASENTPVELRGIMTDLAGVTSFGFYDPTKKQGGWVKQNETDTGAFPVTVRNFDPSSETVTAEYQGRTLTLVMKTPKIEAVAVMAQVPPPQVRPAGPGQPAILPAPTADDARRLEAVAAEVARRRQQRQAAQQPTASPQPPPQTRVGQPAPAQGAAPAPQGTPNQQR